MPDYQKMYHSLFNAVTDAITRLQQRTEQLYMDSPEPVLTALPHDTEKKPSEKKPIILSQKDTQPKDIPLKKKPPSHDER